MAPYDAVLADQRARALLQAPRRNPKLAPDTLLFAVVLDHLRVGWSPEQIAGTLKMTFPDDQHQNRVARDDLHRDLRHAPRRLAHVS